MKKMSEKIAHRIIRTIRLISLNVLRRKKILFKSRYGFYIYLYPGKVVDRSFYLDSFETSNLELFNQIIQPGMVVFDIGANIGIYSLIAAAKTNGEITIHSFEPADDAFRKLNENILLNSYKCIQAHKVGMSDSDGTTQFNLCDDDAYNSLGRAPMTKIIRSVKIDITNIDTFCDKQNIRKIDFVKIDTEGAEFLVIKGGTRIFGNEQAPIIFCEYNRLTTDGYEHQLGDFERIVADHGYQLYETNQGKLKKFDSQTSKSNDIICLKEHHFDLCRDLFSD